MTKQYDRSAWLIENREAINRRSVALTGEMARVRAIYPEVASPEEYRLQVQQQLAAVAQVCGLTISVFDVVSEGDFQSADLKFLRVRLQTSGSLKQFVRFHGQIEGDLKNAFLRKVRIENSMPSDSPTDAVVQAVIIVDIYFRSKV
jgi:hypothetical protein